MQEKHIYEFGPFEIDSVERLLMRAGEVVPLPPMAIDTLLALVASCPTIRLRSLLLKV